MRRITFKQFLETFNFRDVYENNKREDEYDSKIIRIHLPSEEFEQHKWFELGVNDFSCEKGEIIGRALSEEVKNSYVDEISIKNEENYGYIEIWLSKEENKEEDY